MTNLAASIADTSVKFLALDDQVIHAGLNNSALDGDRSGSVDIVARHHAHRNTRPLALPNSFGYLYLFILF